MHRSASLLALTLLPLPGCVFLPPDDAPLERAIRLRLHTDSRQPLAGVVVHLESEHGSERTEQTDADGIVDFRFALPAGSDGAFVRIGFPEPRDPRFAIPAGLRLVYHANGEGIAIEEHAIAVPSPATDSGGDPPLFEGWAWEAIVPSAAPERLRTSADGRVEVVIDRPVD